VRAGDQIDTTLDIRRIPNPAGGASRANQIRPSVPFAGVELLGPRDERGPEVRY